MAFLGTEKPIPLCLSSDLEWNIDLGKCRKTEQQRSLIKVTDKAIERLEKITGPVRVLAIAGPVLSGKSYLMNKMFGLKNDGFHEAQTTDAKIMGLWMQIVPGSRFTEVLLDPDGMTGESLHDNRIFALSVLLASVIIYNSKGKPSKFDLNWIDLNFVETLSKQVHEDEDVFPLFTWLLRDLTEPLGNNVKDFFHKEFFESQRSSCTSGSLEVAERLLGHFPGFDAFSLPPPTSDTEDAVNIGQQEDLVRPNFLSRIEQFRTSLMTKLATKENLSAEKFKSGKDLAAFVKTCVDTINGYNQGLSVQTMLEISVQKSCFEAQEKAQDIYEKRMESEMFARIPCEEEAIQNSHDTAFEASMDMFTTETAEISAEITEKFAKDLKHFTKEKQDSWKRKNVKSTRDTCKSLISQLKRLHLDPVLALLREQETSKPSPNEIAEEYTDFRDAYLTQATGAKHVCEAVFSELQLPELEEYKYILASELDIGGSACAKENSQSVEENTRPYVESMSLDGKTPTQEEQTTSYEEFMSLEKKAPIQEEESPSQKGDPIQEEQSPSPKQFPIQEEKSPFEKNSMSLDGKAPTQEEHFGSQEEFLSLEKTTPIQEEESPSQKGSMSLDGKTPTQEEQTTSYEEFMSLEKTTPIQEEESPSQKGSMSLDGKTPTQEEQTTSQFMSHEKKTPIQEEESPSQKGDQIQEDQLPSQKNEDKIPLEVGQLRQKEKDTEPQAFKETAIPLCLPNNLSWIPSTGEVRESGEVRSFLCVVEETADRLRQIKGPVCVISIAGPCRDGKSYVLGKAFGHPDVFPLGHEFDPKTMGLWIWVVPETFKECF